MKHTMIQAKKEQTSSNLQYSVSAAIQAPPEKIWSYLTNAADYPNWNSTVDRVEGDIVLGKKIKVFAKISPNRAFPVAVAELETNRKMVWKGGMPFGLFKGIRTFLLSSNSGGSTTIDMTENFSGLLLSMMSKSIPDLRPAFEDFVKDLKTVAEG